MNLYEIRAILERIVKDKKALLEAIENNATENRINDLSLLLFRSYGMLNFESLEILIKELEYREAA